MLRQEFKDKYESCQHQWMPHFDHKIDQTPTSLRVAVGILCQKCGMWRTKVLELRFPDTIVNE